MKCFCLLNCLLSVNLQILHYETLRRFTPTLQGFVYESPEYSSKISMTDSDGTLDLKIHCIST